jgi:hypothetical protein
MPENNHGGGTGVRSHNPQNRKQPGIVQYQQTLTAPGRRLVTGILGLLLLATAGFTTAGADSDTRVRYQVVGDSILLEIHQISN